MTTTLLPTLQLWGPINCEHSDLSNLKRTVRSIPHSWWTQHNFPRLSRYQRVRHTQPHARRISRFRRVRIPAHSTFAVSQSLSNCPPTTSWVAIRRRLPATRFRSRVGVVSNPVVLPTAGCQAQQRNPAVARRSFANRPVLHK